MAAVRKDDLDVLLVACLKYLPDDPHPDIPLAFSRLQDARREPGEPGPASAAPGDGQFMHITFMGRIEYTGYVTQITKNGQPAYHIDLPEKIWGGNPLAWVEHAASAWFSDRPVTEESARKAWEAQVRRAEERVRQEAEWRRAQEQRVITSGSADDDDADSDDGFGEAPF